MASCNGLASYQYLTKNLHVWPDFHGNRSPLSDQNLKGMVRDKKKVSISMRLIDGFALLDVWSNNVDTRRKFGNHLFGIYASIGSIYCQLLDFDHKINEFSFQYGTKHILDSLRRQGRPDFETLLICGGLSKNPFFIQTHAEACGLPVLCPNEKEMVLVGAAILGACAAKFYPDLEVTASPKENI